MHFLPRSAAPFSRALLTLGLACSAPVDAHAQTDTATPAEVAPDAPARVQFRVVINAPRPYEKLLENGLDLTRWQRDRGLAMPLLERVVAEARAKATEALAAEGYFSAKVDSRIDMESANQAVVHIDVELGPRTLVREVDLKVQGAATQDQEGRKRIDDMRHNWLLGPGRPFQQKEWDAAKTGALLRLSKGPFAAAKIVESQARIDPDIHSADLSLTLDSGPVFHAGKAEVTGLKRYPRRVVTNMNPFAVGEPYDGLKLDLFQRRLLETGYFDAVQLTIDPDPDQSAAAPLHVNVIEAPSQRIDTGVEYNTDTGAGVTLDYRNADIFDSAWRFRSQLRLNQKEQTGEITFDSPPRPGGVWNTYRTGLYRTDIENQVSREAVVAVAHNWGLQRLPSQVELSAHYERLSIAGFGNQDSHALFVGYRKTFNTTEELISPRKGLIGTVEAGVGLPGASSREFARGRAHVNWLIPAGLRNDFLVRAEVGAVIAGSRQDIPSSFLFRTGGDQSIRGYAYQSIGVPLGQAIVGGRYLALASVGYTRWITDTLGAAVFVDAGDAFDAFSRFRLAAGYGVGVRWRSPVGPFRADVAYGARTHNFRLHFSVGYAF
jgi:translocation and assembly module TamA